MVADHEQQVSNFLDELHKKNEEYRNNQKKLLDNQKSVKETHEILVKAREENVQLKRQIITIK